MWRIKVYKDRILMAISLVGALASILSLGKPLLIESTQWACATSLLPYFV